mgnify:CR=1 FL=1
MLLAGPGKCGLAEKQFAAKLAGIQEEEEWLTAYYFTEVGTAPKDTASEDGDWESVEDIDWG